MTNVHIACQPSTFSLSKDETIEPTTYFGKGKVILPPPPTAPYSRGISWGGKAQTISMLLLDKGCAGNTSSSASKAPSSDNELHIFMDSSEREELGCPSHSSDADVFSSRTSGALLHPERNHPSNAASDNLLASLPSSNAPSPPMFTSSPSIQILHTGSGSTRIINEMLWDESSSGSIAQVSATRDDPLACQRLEYQPRWSSSPGGTSVVPSLSGTMTPPQRESSLSMGVRPFTSSGPVTTKPEDNDTSGGVIERSLAPNASTTPQRFCRDAPPRMPSRRRLSDNFLE
jgi:hypothetical protein